MNHLDKKPDSELADLLKRAAQQDMPEFSSVLHARIMRSALRATMHNNGVSVRSIWLRRALAVAATGILMVTLTLLWRYLDRRTNPAAASTVAVDMSTLLLNPDRLLDRMNRQWPGQLTSAQFAEVQTLARRLTRYALNQLELTSGSESAAIGSISPPDHIPE